ncbi:DinB family protein [Sphingobacterium pedocola]|uniref:Damage-inducible protein DinB n=1 Tax=Sphingobacterium pedocola TaxID=2082722 RepID=A0ABR9T6G2_9SPHI|nr:DinB family protein [Sphingobacterium pedocola]MBE8720908.1 damage-inducible protein DinB [Sphingobacterium pedocola]
MILQYLIQEFEHEVNSTRKLLNAIPEKDLGYKPSEVSWTMGELAQHIATIYYWYVGAFTKDVYDLAADHLERGDTNDINATLALFESNVEKARTALQSLTEERLQDNWTMKAGERIILGPMPRGIVARGFLFNHIYHHRGEMIVYLRATGNRVPGLYGPTYEDSKKG